MAGEHALCTGPPQQACWLRTQAPAQVAPHGGSGSHRSTVVVVVEVVVVVVVVDVVLVVLVVSPGFTSDGTQNSFRPVSPCVCSPNWFVTKTGPSGPGPPARLRKQRRCSGCVSAPEASPFLSVGAQSQSGPRPIVTV